MITRYRDIEMINEKIALMLVVAPAVGIFGWLMMKALGRFFKID